jgi:hypothetical protein
MSVGKRGILQGMLHIYRMYKFVKLVDKENEKLAEKKMLEIKNGGSADGFKLIPEMEAVTIFGDRRVWFKKVGFIRTSQVSMAALKVGYLEPVNKAEKNIHLRLTHLKGLPLIDGFFPFRPGLWKAWHEEHGWMLTSALGAAILTSAIYLGKHLWAIIKP